MGRCRISTVLDMRSKALGRMSSDPHFCLIAVTGYVLFKEVFGKEEGGWRVKVTRVKFGFGCKLSPRKAACFLKSQFGDLRGKSREEPGLLRKERPKRQKVNRSQSGEDTQVHIKSGCNTVPNTLTFLFFLLQNITHIQKNVQNKSVELDDLTEEHCSP